jgi:hypothetical protein
VWLKATTEPELHRYRLASICGSDALHRTHHIMAISPGVVVATAAAAGAAGHVTDLILQLTEMSQHFFFIILRFNVCLLYFYGFIFIKEKIRASS